MSLSKHKKISSLEFCLQACFFSEICEYLNARELFKIASVSKIAWNKLSKNKYILNYVNSEKWLQIKEFKDFRNVVQF